MKIIVRGDNNIMREALLEELLSTLSMVNLVINSKRGPLDPKYVVSRGISRDYLLDR